MEKIDGAHCAKLRKEKGLNQSDFWSQVGVGQSGGSRYESGRAIPRPVRRLVWLVHVHGLDGAVLKKLSKI